MLAAAASDSAAVLAVADAGVLTVVLYFPADTADSAAADSAAVVAAFDLAATAIPADAADILAAASDIAAVRAVADAGVLSFILYCPADAADITASADGAGVLAVADAGALVIPADAADILAAAIDIAAVRAVFDAAPVLPADAADRTAASDGAAVAASFDPAALVMPADAADSVLAGADSDGAVGKGEVFHRAAFADSAKQPSTIILLRIFFADIQPADGVFLAIKGAGVAIVIVVADWRPLVERNVCIAIISQRSIIINSKFCLVQAGVQNDVPRQHRVGGGVLLYFISGNGRVTIDQPSEPIQFPSVADLIYTVYLIRLCCCHICPRCRWMRQQHGAAEQGDNEQPLK